MKRITLVNGAELARDLGVTPAAVSKARQAGRLWFADEERRLYDLAIARLAWLVLARRFRIPSAIKGKFAHK